MPFLTQHGPTFWSQKGQNVEFLKQNFIFQSLRKTEAILLPSMWLKDWLTKVKTSKIVTFCYFWPKMDKNLIFIFHSGIYITTSFLLVNVYLMQNMKKTHWNTSFFVVFTTLDLFWPKFCPKDHTFAKATINIDNLCCNLAVQKKVGKTS